MTPTRPLPDLAPDDAERRLRDVAQFARRLARQLIGDGPDADDVAQEAVIAAWRRAPEDRKHARGWVAQTVRRGVFDRLRSGAARRARERESARPEVAGEPADAVVLLIEHQRRLLDALESLPPEMKVALSTRFLEGLSIQETAERLGVPRETVRTRTRRGLARLRDSLIERDSGSPSNRRSLGWLAGLASTRDPDAPSALALSTAASTYTATAITMKKILFLGAILLIPLFVVVAQWNDGASPQDLLAPGAVTTIPVILGSVDKTPIASPSEVDRRSALRMSGGPPLGVEGATPRGIATVQFIGRDKNLGDDGAMDGELVIGSDAKGVAVIDGRCELSDGALAALRSYESSDENMDENTAGETASLTLNGRAAYLGEAALETLGKLSEGETASVVVLLMSPVQLRVLDARTQRDLEEVSLCTNQDDIGRFAMPDPEFHFWVQSSSRVYEGSSPLTIPPHLPLHSVWVSAKGYAPQLLNLDHSEAGRAFVVELEPAGSLLVTIEPSPARSQDFVLRFFDEEGATSLERRFHYPLALATMLQANSGLDAGGRLTIELDPMPVGKWWVRLERGRRVPQGEVCAAGECEVTAGQRTRLALESQKHLLAAAGTLKGVVRFDGAQPPSGARLRARSLGGVISGDARGKLLEFDRTGEAPFEWELPVGDWELYVTPQQHTFAVSVGPGVRSGVELDLPAPSTLTLVLVDKDTGDPIESPSVYLTTAYEYARSPQSIRGYGFPLVHGEPCVHRIELSPQDLFIFPNLPEYQMDWIPVRLVAPSTELTIECERAATATIRLVSDAGPQLLPPDARIRVVDQDSMALRRYSPPLDTTISLRVNDAGTYQLDIPVPIGFEKLDPVTLEFRKETLPTVDVTIVPTRR